VRLVVRRRSRAARVTRIPTAPHRQALRVACWALAAVIALLAGLGWYALGAERSLAVARERLLAGDLEAARQALGSVHWPEAARRREAGLALLAAAAGSAPAVAKPPTVTAELAFFEPEAALETAVARGALREAERMAALLRASGLPMGALYEAGLRFDRGDVEGARASAAASTWPLASRGLGRRLQRGLELSRGGAPLVVDRSGEPIGTLAPDGRLLASEEAAAALGQGLERASLVPLAVAHQPAPPAGGERALRVTLDLGLSRLALEALSGLRGSIVLIEPSTGAVLAAVTDPLTAAREPQAAFEQRREPASIAKLITTAAALRSHHDADGLIRQMKCTGVERYGGKALWCPAPTGSIAGLDHAMAVSCNLAFANLSMRIGRERLVEEYRRWGFDAPAPALLGAAGRIVQPPELPRELADLSIGLENSSVTPLHAAVLAAVIANGGRLAEPRLLDGRTGLLGLSLEPRPVLSPDAPEIIPAGIAHRLAQSMQAVIAYGTAAGVEPPGLAVAMKTGTAAAPRLGYHVNYIGFAPVDHPALAFCVRATGRSSSHGIRADARLITWRLLAGLAGRPGLGVRERTAVPSTHAAGGTP
jgi:hypothetical protein